MTPTSATRLTDQEILKHFYADHNNEWLGTLLERYTMLLYGVSMKYLKNPEEARDAVQQIFLKAITELHKYEVSYFSSWLYMIAKNHCLMQLRNRHHGISVDLVNEPVSEINEPDPLQDEELLKGLEEALQHLNPEQKTCIRMFYLEKKSYHVIASETGFTLLQVKSYIQNGKRNLRILLEKKINHPDD
ncbi:MAG TPA: sigma-70 family RNA polymerase sigma factor [Puia sp.]|nr:sigma-70 family RNA polymerase sigma factor [Puia sp.]